MAASQREDIRIPSHGEQLAAYHYRPDPTDGDVPCVVMAHGFTGTRDDGLPGYAETFRDAGFAVILFDYRHFGASTGEPRQLLDIGRQLDDYRAVVAWARQLDGIDPRRIVLWGTSFSGGHMFALGADEQNIAAVIAQAPFTDGIPTLMKMEARNVFRATFVGMLDQIGAWLRRPPSLIPAVGDPGTFAVMTAPDAKPGFEALAPPESLWRNECAARIAIRIALYRPALKAPRLTMPLLVCVCDTDTTTPAPPAIKAANRAPRGELRHYSCGHFEIYHDPQAKADQVAFLQRVVPGADAKPER
jgi:dienelactone hydrolase